MGTNDYSDFIDMIQEGMYSSAISLSTPFTKAAEGFINPIEPDRQKDISMIVNGVAAGMKHGG